MPCTDWLPFGIGADDALDDAPVLEVPAPPPNTASSEPRPDLALWVRLHSRPVCASASPPTYRPEIRGA
jgi:hypothetical protein